MVSILDLYKVRGAARQALIEEHTIKLQEDLQNLAKMNEALISASKELELAFILFEQVYGIEWKEDGDVEE